MNFNLIQNLSSIEKNDEYFAGEKAVQLAEFLQHGFTIPKTYVITKNAQKLFFKENNLYLKIKHLLSSINFDDPNSVSQISQTIKQTIESCSFPSDISTQFFNLFEKEHLTTVVMFPSDTSGVLKNVSHVMLYKAKGESAALQMAKTLWAFQYSPHALSQMHELRREIQECPLLLQEVINPEKSGFMYTSIKKGEYEYVKINACLGNNISTNIESDVYLVKKPSAIYSDAHPNPGWSISEIVKNPQTFKYVDLSEEERVEVKGRSLSEQKLTEEEILRLAKIGQDVEEAFYFPQKVSWGISKNKIYIFSSKTAPGHTTHENIASADIGADEPILSMPSYSEVLFQGKGVGKGVSVGRVKIIQKDSDLKHISSDSIVVTKETTKAFKEALRKAAGLITLEKDPSSYTSVHIKEFGIPAVIQAGEDFKHLKNDMLVTVDGNTGEVWKGSKKNLQTPQVQSTASKIFVDIDSHNPTVHKSEADGVFSISVDHVISALGVHPKKLLYDSRLSELEEYLEKFVLQVCQEWYPKPVYYKFSDMTSDAYRALDAGKQFEAEEKNPMLGHRGLLRELSEPYLFDLEIRVLKRIREGHHIGNIHLVFPFVRTKKELTEALRHLERNGLRKSFISRKAMSVNTAESAIFISEFVKTGIDEIFINIKDLVATAGGLDMENQDQMRGRIQSLGIFLELIKKEASIENVLVGAYNIPEAYHEQFVEQLFKKEIHILSVEKMFLETTKSHIRELELNIVKGLGVK